MVRSELGRFEFDGAARVVRSDGEGAPTFYETAEAVKKAEADRIRNHPLVAATFDAFPDAQMVESNEPPRGKEDWSQRA